MTTEDKSHDPRRRSLPNSDSQEVRNSEIKNQRFGPLEHVVQMKNGQEILTAV